MTTLRGADILARTLASAGVRRVFALSGNHIMPVFDAALDAHIDIVHVHHEGAATHMADAWGRLTGEVGVCLFTGGPGHANAVGPLFTALGGESPLLMISGHAPLNLLGCDAFQELRQADMAAPACKASWTLQSVEHLGAEVARALRLARGGRPGPVHLSLPTDVMESTVDATNFALPERAQFDPPVTSLDADSAEFIVEQLARAQRPLILTGPRMGNGRGRTLRNALHAATHIPVLHMESPRGVADPLLGAAAEVLRRADLVLMLGKKLDFTVRFGNSPVFEDSCCFIQIDPEMEALQRAHRAMQQPNRIVFAAQADTVHATRALLQVAATRAFGDNNWAREVMQALHFRPPDWAHARSVESAVHALDIARCLGTYVARTPNVIYISDGGEASQWSQACIGERAAMRMTNGPGGAIGGGVPFALAAKLAYPDAPVLLTIGDGSFGYHVMEYETALRHKLPFVAVVANDGAWNAEYQIQLRNYGTARAIGCEMSQVRYDQLVQSLGGHGEHVTRADDLPAALERAFASGKPACVNVMCQRVAAPSFSARAGTPGTRDAA